MNPKISVIVPVYNAEKFVGKCIESVQAQTYIDWQMIIVDDGSRDMSLDVCQRYADTDKRICVIHQDNAGAGGLLCLMLLEQHIVCHRLEFHNSSSKNNYLDRESGDSQTSTNLSTHSS